MPVYEYRCPAGHGFEVFQRMTDEPVASCEVCGEPVERVLHPVAVHFKGSGFYTTDYARKSSAGSPDGDGSGSGGGDSAKPSKSKDSKQSKDSGAKGSGAKAGEAAKAS